MKESQTLKHFAFFFFALETDHCLSYPCKNNGTCYSREVNYTCECQVGFNGEDCKGWSVKMSYTTPLVDVISVSFDINRSVNFPVDFYVCTRVLRFLHLIS